MNRDYYCILFCRITKRLSLLLCIYFCLFNYQEVKAQYPESEFEYYTAKNGLPDNNVQCISQDAKGFLWVGTESGLVRFDGYQFLPIEDHDTSFVLPGKNVEKIIRISKNRLAVVTRMGLAIVDPLKVILSQFLIPDTTSFSQYLNFARDVIELPDGSLLLVTAAGLCHFNDQGKIIYRKDIYNSGDQNKKSILYSFGVFAANEEEYLISNEENILAVYNSKNKKLTPALTVNTEWKVFVPKENRFDVRTKKISKNGYIIFDIKSDSIKYYNAATGKTVFSALPEQALREFNWTSQISMLSENEFAVNGKKSGYFIFHLNEKTGRIICDPNKYLSNYTCNTLFKDADNRLWMGTRSGFLKHRKNKPFFTTYNIGELTNEINKKVSLNCAYRYKTKLYLACYNDSTSFIIMDTATMKIVSTKRFFKADKSLNSIFSIRSYYPDTLWLGTSDGIIWYDVVTGNRGPINDGGKKIFPGKPILLYPPDRYGNVWICPILGGEIARYNVNQRTFQYFNNNTRPELPFNRVKSVAYDDYGNVWIGGHALTRWDNGLQAFDTLITSYSGPLKFNDDILTLTADKKGSLWLHNNDNGLLEYKIKEKKFEHYDWTKYKPLPHTIQSMGEEVNDKLWFTYAAQLGNFDINTHRTLLFGQQDGIPAERSSSRIIYYDREIKKYYSLHENFLLCFNADIPHTTLSDSLLQFTELKTGNKTIFNPDSLLKLPSGKNNFQLSFAVLDYENATGYEFAYKIDKKEWVNIGSQRVINFNEAQPGYLHIQLMATGKFGELLQKQMTIYIAYPLYMRWWFIALVTLWVALLIYSVYRYRLEQLKKLYSVRSKISQDLHDEIGATLSGLSMYSHLAKEQVRAGKNKEVTKSLNIMQKSATEMVYRLKDIVWLVNPNNDSLQHIASKLEEYAIEIGSAKQMKIKSNLLSYHSEINLSMEQRRTIFMVCKEAINNAAKYSNADLLELNISDRKGHLVFTITDNGKGFDMEHGKRGDGIANMKKRALEINAGLWMRSAENKGTSVTLEVKIV